MAANDYLKVAAAQLKRAAAQLKQQASQMTFERSRVTTAKSVEISRHQNEITANKAAITQMVLVNDFTRKSALEIRSRALEQQVAAKKAEIKRITDQLNNIARAKQQTADSLTNEARRLEMQASSPLLAS